MRAAIAGKDDEQFLADEKDYPALKAAATPPVRPGSVPASSLPAPGAKINAAVKQSSAPPAAVPQAKPAAPPLARPKPQTSAAPFPTTPQAKPAILPQTAPVKPAGTVKPAFDAAH
jgi:hypothetical protein